MMTPERRAALKDRWSGGAYEELFAEIDYLRAALREAQEEARVHESNKDTAIEEWARVERERDALQRQVEALEAALRRIDRGETPVIGLRPELYGHAMMIARTALRGEEAG